MLGRVGPVWTTIGLVMAIGLGIMLSVSVGETKRGEVEQKR